LTEALRSRHLLLVLDNCEHLVAGCAQLASTLLRQSPKLKIITSSREPLSIEGETILGVAPLAVYDFWRSDPLQDLDKIAQYESVQLFVERAAAVRSGFSLTAENATLVARICWRLDGIPLAIELAAARVKVVPLAEILTRLDDRFRLLTGGSRSALPRQQTLGALIDWSYDLLSAPEQILFRRLAVFVGGRTLEMAEAVCSGDDLEARDIFDLLCSLADKSLLVVETGRGGETRYTMLESIWDYANDKLTRHGEEERFLQRHLEFFSAYAVKAEPHLLGPDQEEWMDKLASDHSNLVRAVETSLRRPETVMLGLRLAACATRYWEVRSYLTEGYEQFRELFAKAGSDIPAELRAKAEMGAGRLSWCQDRDEDALRHYEASRALYENLGMKEQVGLAEALLGFTQRNEGNIAAARRYFESALATGEALKSDRLTAMALSGLSTVIAAEGDLIRARSIKEKCVRLFEAMGDHWVTALVKGSLAKVCFAAGDLAASRRFIIEALTITRTLRNNWSVPYAIEGIADICMLQGEAAKAVQLYGAASAHREALALGFSPIEERTYGQALARLHDMVPEQPFREAWEKGRGLGFDAAIKLALEPAQAVLSA
jgi:predicted ATPase